MIMCRSCLPKYNELAARPINEIDCPMCYITDLETQLSDKAARVEELELALDRIAQLYEDSHCTPMDYDMRCIARQALTNKQNKEE